MRLVLISLAAVQVPATEASPSPSPPARSRSKWWKKNILKPADSYGYVPCQCVDVCGDGCVCAESTYCDEYCNCPTSCKLVADLSQTFVVLHR